MFMVYLALREKLTNDPEDAIVAIASCTGALLTWMGIFGVMGWWMLGDFHIHNRQGSYVDARYGDWDNRGALHSLLDTTDKSDKI